MYIRNVLRLQMLFLNLQTVVRFSKMRRASDKKVYSLKPVEAGNVLATAIQRFFAEGKLVDVKISSGNVVLLSCHKIILSSFSTYFETLLMETEGATVLNMDSISAKHAEQLRSIINFMYGYNIQVYRHECALLMEAAKMFGVSALIKTLQSTLERTPQHQDAVIVLKPTGISSLLLVNFQRFRKVHRRQDRLFRRELRLSQVGSGQLQHLLRVTSAGDRELRRSGVGKCGPSVRETTGVHLGLHVRDCAASGRGTASRSARRRKGIWYLLFGRRGAEQTLRQSRQRQSATTVRAENLCFKSRNSAVVFEFVWRENAGA